MKKIPRILDSDLLDKDKHHDYDTNKSQNSQSNVETNLDKINNLNIG